MQSDKESSYYAMDMTTLAFEQTNKRMFMLCILLIVLLLGTNIGWFVYENQFEDAITVTQEVDAQSDGEGDLNLNTVGGDYIDGGKSEDQTNDN